VPRRVAHTAEVEVGIVLPEIPLLLPRLLEGLDPSDELIPPRLRPRRNPNDGCRPPTATSQRGWRRRQRHWSHLGHVVVHAELAQGRLVVPRRVAHTAEVEVGIVLPEIPLLLPRLLEGLDLCDELLARRRHAAAADDSARVDSHPLPVAATLRNLCSPPRHPIEERDHEGAVVLGRVVQAVAVLLAVVLPGRAEALRLPPQQLDDIDEPERVLMRGKPGSGAEMRQEGAEKLLGVLRRVPAPIALVVRVSGPLLPRGGVGPLQVLQLGHKRLVLRGAVDVHAAMPASRRREHGRSSDESSVAYGGAEADLAPGARIVLLLLLHAGGPPPRGEARAGT